MNIGPLHLFAPSISTRAARLAAKPSQVQAGIAPTESFTSSGTAEDWAPSKLRQAFDSVHNAGGPAITRLLDDNTEAWNARWKAIESADNSINAQYFSWDKDVFGKAMLGFIYKKTSQEGVKTRLMVDATGDTFGTRGFKSHIGGRDYLQEVVALPNAEAKVYHPHHKKIIDGLLHIGTSYIAASNHDKILEVDGDTAITGGRNIGHEYFATPEDFSGAWRDTDVVIHGEAPALALRNAFEVEYGAPWINDKITPDLLGNWVKRDIELLGAYAAMDSWLKDTPLTDAEKDAARKSPEIRESMSQALFEEVLVRLPADGAKREPGNRELKAIKKLTDDMVAFPDLRGSYHLSESATHQAEVKILDRTSVVGTAQDGIGASLAKMVASAEKRIVIENPYIVMTDSLLESLRDAGHRGVEIWLGTNSPSSTDSAVTQAFFLQDWPKILATVPNMKFFVATGDRKLHAKVAVADDEVSLVSTYNLDLLSTEINSEVGALVWSQDFAKDTYGGILKDHADPRNGVKEYTILRDEDGTPIRYDALPVLDEKGELVNPPEITYGPGDHLSTKVLDKYAKKMERWAWLRQHIPQLSSLDTFRVRFGSEV